MFSALACFQALAQAPTKSAVETRWDCIGVNTSEGNPRRAQFANQKGCVRDFHLACEDKDGAAEIACLKRETAIWDAIIDAKLIAGAREGEADKKGVTAAMTAAARAARAHRAATCGFVRKYGVNTNPMSVARCELDATAQFAMTIYGWLYTP